jgi:hypothetical protein
MECRARLSWVIPLASICRIFNVGLEPNDRLSESNLSYRSQEQMAEPGCLLLFRAARMLQLRRLVRGWTCVFENERRQEPLEDSFCRCQRLG